jgi:hypothetical protein
MERLSDEVRRSLGAAGVPDAGALAAVVRAWPSAAGETIARFAWPSRIGRDGTLHVATASSTWAFELSQLEHDVRAKLAALVGDDAPPAIRFAPGPLPAPGPPAPEPESAERPRPDPADDREAAALAAAIGDRELREIVRRAAAASLAGRRSGRFFW